MSNATEMAEYIMMWEVLQEVIFSEEKDEISWKWTSNEMYSSSLLMSYSSKGDTLPLTAERFGRRRLKASIVSSLGS